MPWNETDREKYAPCHQRYASDLSDGEFALVQPLLPPSKRRGRKPTDPRHILDALFYMVRTGCQWRYLPKDFPPFTTVQNRFYAWRDSGLWEQIAAVLVMHVREAEGKDASPTVVIVDSQAVKTTDAGGERGYDVAKATKGRKRHVAVDTLGLPIKCQITAANVQDRDALAPLLKAVSRKSPWVKLAFADSGYNGDEAQRAAFAASRIRTTVVKRTDKQLKGFVVLPKRWIAERTFGWINRARRLAKDFETLVTSSLGWFMLAVSFLLIRRIDRDYKPPSDFESGSQLLGLSRSTLYYEPRPVPAAELAIMRRIDEPHLDYPFAGSRMLRDLLRGEGVVIGRELVATLMRRMGIEAIYRKPNTSKAALGHKIDPYLLRGLAVEQPNQVGAMDITYIPMARGFVYLAAVFDWFSRRVLSWRLSITMDVDFCLEAVEEALARYGRPKIFNTDQGSQFTSAAFTGLLLENAIAVQHGWPRRLA